MIYTNQYLISKYYDFWIKLVKFFILSTVASITEVVLIKCYLNSIGQWACPRLEKRGMFVPIPNTFPIHKPNRSRKNPAKNNMPVMGIYYFMHMSVKRACQIGTSVSERCVVLKTCNINCNLQGHHYFFYILNSFEDSHISVRNQKRIWFTFWP